MPLDDLVHVIETLQQRIKDHGDSLRQNETRTRMALIDPLLQALGWDVADPSAVMPEYDVSGKRADYALLSGNSVVVFLEAKRLDESLSNHRSQIVAYASELGIKFPALTNGNEWEVYDNSKLVPIEQRRILNLSINGTPAHQCALKFLLLWRPNLAAGQPVQAKEPILSATIPTLPTVEPIINTQQPATPPEPPSGDGWVSLAGVPRVTHKPAPETVRFPSGEEKQLKSWSQMLFEVADWLVRTGKLTSDKCPVTGGKTTYVAHTMPQHSNGTNFNHQRRLSNGLLWLRHSMRRIL